MNQERIYKVLLGPHVSEKSAMSAEAGNQVVFKVLPTATKLEIKHAVEKLFKVEVVDVRTVNMKGKVKRNRFGLSKKPNWKKAYVSLVQGQEIDFAVAE
ncbi:MULTISPECIES: 50S ribosomal protein L23 [Spongiibacter]|uniref:50S ribosomal protein L23 n=1 Tax=Spongiibacter TaxID=630749 RepID=UPI0003B38D13|nr:MULTISPECIES: 50S ribosomal protein L23 [Spongiibacter]MAY40666.1 50S ribosomal protein L23 [Spongiibacter sp.]MBI59324.1 50S ribosomal protein L23 [Spongiibacter sp.]MBU73436.1 50S ribosomal protein L23 [Spongiibacter sp.]|tara:strand:+ start:6757 stop:7053 length:297 start_codon:yes stop_codon:yes gene_type:complete